MAISEKNKETKTEIIGCEHYCSYCGEHAKRDETWDEYDQTITYYCDCDGAKIATKAKEEYNKLMSTIKYRKNIGKHFAKLQYQYELQQLKNKYQNDDIFED